MTHSENFVGVYDAGEVLHLNKFINLIDVKNSYIACLHKYASILCRTDVTLSTREHSQNVLTELCKEVVLFM